MSVALLQEVRQAISFKQQPDLVTALGASDMWSLRQTNTELIQAQPINEDDSTDLGKGVYATETFPSYIDAKGPWNGRLTSESFAQLFAFGIGKTPTKTATSAPGGFKYEVHEPVFATDGISLPVATAAVQIRTGGSAITDKAIVGLCCEEFGIELKIGPGRDNAVFTSQWVGTGKYVKPSTVVIPDLYQEHTLNAGNVTAMTLIGFDYLANTRFVNLKFNWKNNLRDTSSYYPGSGNQGGYQLRGRMRRGVPTITLQAIVECDSGSSEEDLLLSQTSGTGHIKIEGALIGGVGPEKHTVEIQFFKLIPKSSPISDQDGIASYQVDYFIMQDPTNGVLQIDSIIEQDNLLAVGP